MHYSLPSHHKSIFAYLTVNVVGENMDKKLKYLCNENVKVSECASDCFYVDICSCFFQNNGFQIDGTLTGDTRLKCFYQLHALLHNTSLWCNKYNMDFWYAAQVICGIFSE